MKIVFLSFPAYGHINPTLGLVKELVAVGYQVLYYASAPFRESISLTGAEFRDYGVSLPALDLSRNLVHSTNIMLEYGELLYERMLAEVKTLGADLIIHDGVCGWGKCIAAYLKIPAASSISSFAMNESILKGLNSAGDTAKFFYYLFFSDYGKRFFSLVANQHERLRTCGLPVPAKGRIDLVEFSTSPERLNLVYATREWQPEGERFGDSYKFIGPAIAARSEDESFVFPASGGEPVVYLSMGTILNRDPSLYRTCFAALAGMKVQVIVSAGSGMDLIKQDDLPQNFHLYASVPQLKVLQKASLFISQGGMNSVNESMYFGVPMICIPVTGEQTLNAKRVSAAGAGILLQRPTVSTLRSAVQRALLETSYQQRSQKVGESFKSSGGFKLAVDEIKKYLQR